MEENEFVAASQDVMHGKPVIKGTRVPVDVVLNTIADGVEVSEVCREFDLEREQVLAAVRYAAERVSGEEFKGLEA